MAISRFSSSRVTQGLPKYQSAWDQDGVAQGAIEPIAKYVAIGASGATGFDFRNIPQTYTDLLIVQYLRSNRAATTEQFWQRFNDDATSAYSSNWVQGDGASATSSNAQTQTVANRFFIPAASATANLFGISQVHIMDYKSTSKFKTVLTRWNSDVSGSGTTGLSVGMWRSMNAIQTINVATENGSVLTAGSTIYLYGIRSAS